MYTYSVAKFANSTLKLSMFFAMLIAASAALPNQASAQRMAGSDIRKAVGGHKLVLSVMGVQLPIAYRANGTMKGSMASYVASMAGESKSSDTGKWLIKDGRLCQRWNNWLDGKSYCFTLSGKGNTINWSASNGYSGTARIVR